MKKFFLEVIEADDDLIGRNLVTISSGDMDFLKITSGDIVKIAGEKDLYLKVVRSEKAGGTIGLDGVVRSVLGTSVGEKVQVEPSEKLPALKSVTLSILPHEKLSNDQLKTYNSQLKEMKTFRKLLVESPVTVGQKISVPTNVGNFTYIVTKSLPKKSFSGMVNENTKIEIAEDVGEGSGVNVYYEDIGGLKEEIEKIREMVEFPMKHPEIFQRLGVSAPKGVLLTGPPGTGKTLLAKAVATETDANFISIAGPEIMSKYHGGSEENLRTKFEDAEKNAPSIVFIDEIDAIAPKRGEAHDQAEKRVVTQLLTLMDGLKSRGQVVVMAATNRPDDLDEALRRPGRFDRELKINPPKETGRKEILKIHTRNMPLENREKILEEFSKKTLGFTGADLEVLCKEAALRAVKPFYKDLINLEDDEDRKFENFEEGAGSGEGSNGKNDGTETKKQKILSKINVTREHFAYAMKNIEPSAMREVLIEKPHVRWSDIGGLDDVKEKLRELIELPLVRPDLFKEAGIKPSKAILISGPPGTGKTLLAKAVATESKANFISIKGPELISKWVGESEKRVREVFKKARQVAPCIIFFDEFDSISKQRGSSLSDSTEKVVNQLLTELDGVEELEKVVVLAATNRVDLIDAALTRPGRFDSKVKLKIPDKETRKEIFDVHTRDMPLEKEVNLKALVDKTPGWTGADVEALARMAGISAIKRYYNSKTKGKLKVNKKDFDSALEEVAESIGKPHEDDGIGNVKDKTTERKIKTAEGKIKDKTTERKIKNNPTKEKIKNGKVIKSKRKIKN